MDPEPMDASSSALKTAAEVALILATVSDTVNAIFTARLACSGPKDLLPPRAAPPEQAGPAATPAAALHPAPPPVAQLPTAALDIVAAHKSAATHSQLDKDVAEVAVAAHHCCHTLEGVGCGHVPSDAAARLRKVLRPFAEAVEKLKKAVDEMPLPPVLPPSIAFYKPPALFQEVLQCVLETPAVRIMVHGPQGVGKTLLTKKLHEIMVQRVRDVPQAGDGDVAAAAASSAPGTAGPSSALPAVAAATATVDRGGAGGGGGDRAGGGGGGSGGDVRPGEASAATFPDGIVLVEFGRGPRETGADREAFRRERLQELVHRLTGKPTAETSLAALCRLARGECLHRACLIIFDDVWPADAELFKDFRGKGMALLTSRHRSTVVITARTNWAVNWSGVRAWQLDREALEPLAEPMLAAYLYDRPDAKGLREDHVELGRQLVGACRANPLLMRLSVSKLRMESPGLEGTAWAKVLGDLRTIVCSATGVDDYTLLPDDLPE